MSRGDDDIRISKSLKTSVGKFRNCSCGWRRILAAAFPPGRFPEALPVGFFSTGPPGGKLVAGGFGFGKFVPEALRKLAGGVSNRLVANMRFEPWKGVGKRRVMYSVAQSGLVDFVLA